MAKSEKAQEVIDNYVALSEVMLGTDSIIDSQAKKMGEQFNAFGLVNEELAQALTKLYVDSTIAFNKEALSTATGISKLDADENLREAQTDLVKRQTSGYNDNVLIKAIEHKSGLASFAINKSGVANATAMGMVTGESGSNYGTSVNAMIKELHNRIGVELKDPDSVEAPSQVVVTAESTTSIKITWGNVAKALGYRVVRNQLGQPDVEIKATTTEVIDENLVQGSQYAYQVFAVGIDDSLSKGSQVVIGTTL